METRDSEPGPPTAALLAAVWVAAAAFGAMGAATWLQAWPAALAALVGVALLLVTRAWPAALAGSLVGAGAAGVALLQAWLGACSAPDCVAPELARPAVAGCAVLLALGIGLTLVIAARHAREHRRRGAA